MTKGPKGLSAQGLQGLLADSEEPAATTPFRVVPAEEEAALKGIAAEDRKALIPTDAHRRAERHDRELPLEVAVLQRERQELGEGCRSQSQPLHLSQNFVDRRVPVKVYEREDHVGANFVAHDRKSLAGDVGIDLVEAEVGLEVARHLAQARQVHRGLVRHLDRLGCHGDRPGESLTISLHRQEEHVEVLRPLRRAEDVEILERQSV